MQSRRASGAQGQLCLPRSLVQSLGCRHQCRAARGMPGSFRQEEAVAEGSVQGVVVSRPGVESCGLHAYVYDLPAKDGFYGFKRKEKRRRICNRVCVAPKA